MASDTETAAAIRYVHGKGGTRLELERIGDTSGLAVLLLPGGAQTRHSWRTTAHALAERGYDALIADLRGHGGSDWAEDGDYSLDAFRDDVPALISAIGRPVIVVGASQGGVASLLAAGECSDSNMLALVMVDIAAKIDPEGGRRIYDFFRAAPDGFASLEEASDLISSFMPGRPRPRDPSGLMRNLRLRADGRLIWHWDPRYLRGNSFEEAQSPMERLEAAASGVNVPTLVVRGEYSEVLTKDDAVHFASLIQEGRGRTAEVPGAGHMIVGDQNGAFSASVIEFLVDIGLTPD